MTLIKKSVTISEMMMLILWISCCLALLTIHVSTLVIMVPATLGGISAWLTNREQSTLFLGMLVGLSISYVVFMCTSLLIVAIIFLLPERVAGLLLVLAALVSIFSALASGPICKAMTLSGPSSLVDRYHNRAPDKTVNRR